MASKSSSKNNKPSSWITNHPVIVIMLWVIIVIGSFNGASLLQSEITQEAQRGGSTTEATLGLDLKLERFNISTETITHIVVLHSDLVNFSKPEWTGWLLAYALWINNSVFPMGYSSVISYPIAMQFSQELASSMISDDFKATVVYIQGNSTKTVEDAQGDVKAIRDVIRNMTGFNQFFQNLIQINAIPNLAPSEAEVNSMEILLTGDAANFEDVLEVSHESFRSSELISIILVVIVLFLVFRTPVGVLMPIVALFSSLFGAFMATYLLSRGGLFTISEFIPNIISMIGIAVAVDYNLFSLVRYREEYRKRKARLLEDDQWNNITAKETQKVSAIIMNRTSGRAVIYSGFTVIIGFSALLVHNADLTLSMAVSVSIVVALSFLSANTLTPAILALIGKWVDWPSILSRSEKEIEEYRKETRGEAKRLTFWARWSKAVMRNPWKALFLSLLVITPFIVFSSQTQVALDTVKQLPAGTESRLGYEILQDKFNLGEFTPFEIVIDTKIANSVFNSTLFNRTAEFANWALSFSKKWSDGSLLRFKSVTAANVITHVANRTIESMGLQTFLFLLQNPSFAQHASRYINLNNGNNTFVISITSNLDPGSAQAWSLVGEIRKAVRAYFGDLGYDTYVTGLPSILKDSSDSMYSDVPLILLVAVILIYIALFVLFRSVILPLVAIVTIAGSILFGLGILVVIFQHGFLVGLVGGEQVSGITFFIPVFLFTTILGLGMDYSIFLITRIKEEYDKGESTEDAVGIGVEKTAGVITSAATVMITTFLVFAFSPLLILKTMGLAMATAIFIDATLSRTVLVPATMRLLGKYNWYIPKKIEKILPKLGIEH